MDELVERIWDGPFGDTVLPDGTRLRVGDTYTISAEQAKSGHWKKPPRQKADPPAAPTTEKAAD